MRSGFSGQTATIPESTRFPSSATNSANAKNALPDAPAPAAHDPVHRWNSRVQKDRNHQIVSAMLADPYALQDPGLPSGLGAGVLRRGCAEQRASATDGWLRSITPLQRRLPRLGDSWRTTFALQARTSNSFQPPFRPCTYTSRQTISPGKRSYGIS